MTDFNYHYKKLEPVEKKPKNTFENDFVTPQVKEVEKKYGIRKIVGC